MARESSPVDFARLRLAARACGACARWPTCVGLLLDLRGHEQQALVASTAGSAARQRGALLCPCVAHDATERDGAAGLEHDAGLRTGVTDAAVALDLRVERAERQLD